MSWSFWTKLGLMLLAFVVGLLLGVAGTLRTIDRRIQELRDPNSWSPRTMAWLETELKLSADQRGKITPLVEHAVKDLSELHDQAEAERKIILGRMFVDMNPHLSSQQQQHVREIITQRREKSSPLKSLQGVSP